MLETENPSCAKKGWFFEILTSKINLKISKEESSCSHLHEGLAILIMGEFLVIYSWSVFIRYILIAGHSFTSSVIMPRPDKVLPQVTIWPMSKVMAQACYLHNLCVLLHINSDYCEMPLASSQIKITMFKFNFLDVFLCSRHRKNFYKSK